MNFIRISFFINFLLIFCINVSATDNSLPTKKELKIFCRDLKFLGKSLKQCIRDNQDMPMAYREAYMACKFNGVEAGVLAECATNKTAIVSLKNHKEKCDDSLKNCSSSSEAAINNDQRMGKPKDSQENFNRAETSNGVSK
jgi:hypothetical protein